MNCPNCNAPIPQGGAFCTNCGTPVPPPAPQAPNNVCVNCGAIVPEGSSFCTNCGNPVAAPAPAPTPVYQTGNTCDPAMLSKAKGMATAGLILGIACAVIGFLVGMFTLGLSSFIGFPCALVGLILAVNAGKAYRACNYDAGLATAALIVSIIATCLSGLFMLTCGLCTVCTCIADGDVMIDAFEEGFNEGYNYGYYY